MLVIIITIVIIFFVVVFVGAVIAAPIVAMFVKPFNCPGCDRKIKLVGKTAKCRHCKTKLLKHANGQYVIRS